METKMTPEIQFAQHLASNDPRIRNQAVKKLAKWFKTRSCGKPFDLEELMKIWKGLFYCMWMSDKPLVQEKLADKLSEMIHCFGQSASTYTFIEVFFQTMAREWYGLDRYRIEKFMMLIRRFIRQSFQLLKQQQWKPKPVKIFLQILERSVLNPTCDKTPAGLKIHVADVYLEELARLGGTDFKTKKLLKFLDPYCAFLVRAKDPMLTKAISKSVFLDLIESEEPLFSFKVKYNLVADLIVQHASDENVNKDNRAKMYKLVGTFRDAGKGIFRSDRVNLEDVDLGKAIDKKEIISATKRYLNDQDKVKKERESWKKTGSKRKKSSVATFNDTEGFAMNGDGEDGISESKNQKQCENVNDERNVNKSKTKHALKTSDKKKQNQLINGTTKAKTRKTGSNKQSTARAESMDVTSSARNDKLALGEHLHQGSAKERSKTTHFISPERRNAVNNVLKTAIYRQTNKIQPPKFTITPLKKAKTQQNNSCAGFVITPQTKTELLDESVVNNNPIVQKSSTDSDRSDIQNVVNTPVIENVVHFNERSSARSVYNALAKKHAETITRNNVFNPNVTSNGSDDKVETSGPVINIETRTPNVRADSELIANGNTNTSQKKRVSFASFEKFVSTPPCFFRKSASKLGTRKPSTPTVTSGILKKSIFNRSI